MRWWLIAALLLASFFARAEERLATDLREQIVKLPFELTDIDRRKETQDLVLTIFRPQGAGPFPVAVLSHGRLSQTRMQARFRMEAQARYFVRKGFLVVVPTRVGYGPWATDFDPERGLDCGTPNYAHLLTIAGGEIIAALNYARSLPDADMHRAILAGVSVGGISTIAAAATNPPGVVAAINFSGGAGGDPVLHPGAPCASDQLELAFKLLGHAGRIPTLWIYAENDRFFGAAYSKRWASIYKSQGAPIEFDLLPPYGEDGHGIFNSLDSWTPITERFLAQYGFVTAAATPRPAATHFADVNDVASVPHLGPRGRDSYAKFLQATPPRAFALSPNGATGYAYGQGSRDMALDYCRKYGDHCALYAIDNDVVWQPPAAPAKPLAKSAASKDALRDQIRANFQQQSSGN